MEREKPSFDILGRIEQERLARGWSEYTLAENSGLTQSTISTWRRRNLQPSVASLEKICSGLGITLAQFFQENPGVSLSAEQAELLSLWGNFSPRPALCFPPAAAFFVKRITLPQQKRDLQPDIAEL